MNWPCDTDEYDQFYKEVPISDTECLRKCLQLDKPPPFYAGLFQGYYKLHTFLAELPEATLEDKADFAMSIAVFLSEKLVGRKEPGVDDEQ